MNLANSLALHGRRTNEDGVCGFYLGPADMTANKAVYRWAVLFCFELNVPANAEGVNSYEKILNNPCYSGEVLIDELD